jgi:biotin carboxyl carrier protein
MKTIKSQMAGTVWKIVATVGQEVDYGDTIMVLESMKMEIPVVAPLAGTVTEIAVQPDTQIHEGELVAVIDG